MKPSRLVDLVDGGTPARKAWKSLRKQVDADLERHLRHHGRWPAVKELLAYAVDREPSIEADAYLLTAGHLLKKLGKDTDHPTARAACLGMSAAISIRLGNRESARRSVQESIQTIRRTIAVDMRALRGARRRARYHDLLYRQRYLGNEVMALKRFLGEDLIVLDGGASVPRKPTSRKSAARKRPTRRGRAKMPSWDEIVFGVAQAPD